MTDYHNAPGTFNDRNETAAQALTHTQRALKDAWDLYERVPKLAPMPGPYNPFKEAAPVDEPAEEIVEPVVEPTVNIEPKQEAEPGVDEAPIVDEPEEPSEDSAAESDAKSKVASK